MYQPDEGSPYTMKVLEIQIELDENPKFRSINNDESALLPLNTYNKSDLPVDRVVCDLARSSSRSRR